MKLWQIQSDINKTIEQFTIGQDQVMDLELAYYDVIGSMAHAKMLLEIGILQPAEHIKLHKGLVNILNDVLAGNFVIKEGVEDVHSQVELILTDTLDQVGKKIHSGRSRNDQVLLDLKLYMRDQIHEIVRLVEPLFNQLISLSNRYQHVLLPGYTHFQVAMPSSFGLWFGAYAESLSDDLRFLKAAFYMINRNPLGSAAGYGSSFPLKRQITTDLLGFDSMNFNVVYAQMGRGKAEKSLAMAMVHFADTLGRMAYDICLYMSQNFSFLSFPDEYTTGSSIMPHKKNPDVFEIIRARCNKIKCQVNDINLVTSNLPSGYHRDMQLLKQGLFDSIESLKECLYMTSFMLEKVVINENILDEKKYDLIFSVELVNELVLQGKSFRDAYLEVGKLIKEGRYKPDKNINHTHEGSIGQLCNNQIEEYMSDTINFFMSKFADIDSSVDQLIKNT